MLAIIGGSGLTKLPELEITERKIVRTPYGLTSSPILFGRLGRLDIVFLARHGFSHTIAPHEINYRANIWALHSLGVENIIAISSVVGINPDFENGSLVLPDDLIDYTYGRKDTFFEGQECPVVHTDFFNPYSNELRQELLNITKAHNVPIYDSAVYGCLQGPRRPTHAEIARYRRDGVDVLGMTGMPEAVLARELKMAYAHFCSVSSIDCFDNGKGNEGCDEQVSMTMTKNPTIIEWFVMIMPSEMMFSRRHCLFKKPFRAPSRAERLFVCGTRQVACPDIFQKSIQLRFATAKLSWYVFPF